MLQVNVVAPMTLMNMLAPKMVEQEDGAIINIGQLPLCHHVLM